MTAVEVLVALAVLFGLVILLVLYVQIRKEAGPARRQDDNPPQ